MEASLHKMRKSYRFFWTVLVLSTFVYVGAVLYAVDVERHPNVTFISLLYLALFLGGCWMLIRTMRHTEALEATLAERNHEWRRQAILLRHIFDALPHRISYRNALGVYEGCNKATEKFFGLPESEIVGRSDDDLFSHDPGIVASSLALLARTRQTRKPEHGEEIINLPDGRQQVYETYLCAYGPETEEPMGFIGISHDITLRKEAERALDRAHVAAMAAREVKAGFVANMSHEIRTPMNGIMGMTHLLLRTPELPENVRTGLEKIEDSARQLMELLSNILDFSRLEASALVLDEAQCDLSGILSGVDAATRPQAEAKGLAFSLECSADLPDSIMGDAKRLGQVLRNLCGNAVKFTDTGSVRMTVAQEARTATDGLTGAWLRFDICDTGVGIPADKLGSVFDTFMQADSSPERRFGGAGLGLALCRQLVELMGGTLTVHSVEGQGSQFCLRVPLNLPVHETSPLPAPRKPPEDVDTAILQGKTILVVEDNPINQEVAVALLQDRGVIAHVAENGQQGVEMAEARPYDLILMDIQMPVMGGLEAARRIRTSSRSHLRGVPILAMTAHATMGDRNKSLASGMNDHITKPLDVSGFYATLSHWLRPQA